MNYFSDESSHFDQREMVLSPSLCPPGPHVFLLTIRVDRAFTETHRRSVQEHVELISEHIWSRVILLFTFGDWLGATTTEQYIESEGTPLQWLVDRCSDRYHVLNSRTKGEGFQVRELIGKIEETMSGCCSSWHYEIEMKVLQEVERRMKREAERVRKRLMKKEQQRRRARAQLEKMEPLPELRLILVGGRKVGKSSCGNTILSTDSFGTFSQTTSCTEKQGHICGKKVSVLDTPGCLPVTSDLLTASCAILLVVNISSSFTDLHRAALEKQLEDGGSQMWKKTMVLFSHGDWLGDTSTEQRIEGEGGPLQGLVERCGNRYHVLDNKNWGDGAQVRELLDLVEEMLVEERLGDLHRGDHMWKGISAEKQQQNVTACGKDLTEHLSSGHPPSRDSCEAAAAETALVVALPAGGARHQAGLTFVDRDAFMSYMATLFYGRQSSQGLRQPAADLPFQLLAPHRQLRLISENHMVVFSCQTQQRKASEADAISARTLCHPALRGRTLQRLSESGNLQALIDQWGCSSLKELEDFIDSYFEMVWEQTMESLHSSEPESLSTEPDTAVEETGREELLLSIDRKLSKLDILEEIRNDVAELRQNLESSWRAIQQLGEKWENDSDKKSGHKEL
uniref:Si:ch211-214j24.15 n=1 Tax=Oryzias latipes TaxID=8090 RepID=A0A3P9KPQ1_ORYLA